MKISKFFFLFFFVGALFSCSSDDDVIDEGPVEPGEPEVLMGIFVDAEVGGLKYVTETQSGTTNVNGEYNYLEGETVTFSVGDIELGSGPATGVMSPLSIASTANATIESQEVKNMAALLQSLDVDADPSNGILIEAATVAAISVSEIDFSEPIHQLLGEIVAEINIANDSNLKAVYPEEAAAHLAASLGVTYEAEADVFGTFVPGFTSYYKGTNDVWIHESNEEGLLVKSTRYDKYPFQAKSEFNFITHDAEGFPTEYSHKNFQHGLELTSSTTNVPEYTEDRKFEGFSYENPETGEIIFPFTVTSWDENNRIRELHHLDSEGNFMQRYEAILDENGKVLEGNSYDSESGGELIAKTTYTYNEYGDIDVVTSGFDDQTYSNQYFYRSDRSLERRVDTYSYSSNRVEMKFNELEVPTEATMDFGSFIILRYFDEHGRIAVDEYYDPAGTHTRTETFAPDGTLISREYH